MIDYSKLNAVTFVKDDIVRDENLNNMFLTPYTSETYFDIEKIRIIENLRDELYSQKHENKKENRAINRSYSKMRKFINIDKLNTVNKVITDYLYMNIKDLLMSSIMKFSSTYLPDDTVLCNNVLNDIPRFNFMVNNFDSYKGMNFNMYKYLVKIHINNYMDAVFSQITRVYFDWLNNMISYYISSNGGLDQLYINAYTLAYEGIKPTDIDETPDNVKYTTIVTIYREALNGELILIRKALVLVSENVFNMVLEGYNFMMSIAYQYNGMLEYENNFLQLEDNNG